jgi:hypothetical protein
MRERKKMRYLCIGVFLMAAGCASLDSDLKSAEAKCPPSPAMTPFIACLNGVEGPVWQKDSPGDASAYQDFAAARLGLAQNLDSGKITPAQFTKGTADARAKFAAALTERAKSLQREAERERTEDEVQNLGKMTSGPMSPDHMGMGMGEMNSGM